MDKAARTLRITKLQLLYSVVSPKYIIAMIMTVLYAAYITLKYSKYVAMFGEPVNAFEGYLCVSSSGYEISVMIFLFIIAVSDAPFTGNGFNNEFIRVQQNEWIAGKIIFIFLTACIMQLLTVTVSALLLSGNTFSNNAWSFPFSKLVKEGAMMDVGIEYDGLGVLLKLTPFMAAAVQSVLIILYNFLLGTIMFTVSIVRNRIIAMTAVFVVHAGGFALCFSNVGSFFLPFPNTVLAVILSQYRNGNLARSVIYIVTLAAAVVAVSLFILNEKELKEG